MAWADLPRATPVAGGTLTPVAVSDFVDLAKALLERAALVGYDLSLVLADVLALNEDQAIKAAHLRAMQDAVFDVCQRYQRDRNELYTLETLLTDAGVGGIDPIGFRNWTRWPSRLGTASYGYVQAGDVCAPVEHVNEMYQALILLTKPRMRTYFPFDKTIQGQVQRRGGTHADLYNQAYSAVFPANNDITYNAFFYNVVAFGSTDPDDNIVRVAVGMNHIRFQLYYTPKWSLLPGDITWASGDVRIEFAQNTTPSFGNFRGTLTEEWFLKSDGGISYARPLTATGSGWPTIYSDTGLDGTKTIDVSSILPTDSTQSYVLATIETDYSQHAISDWPPPTDPSTVYDWKSESAHSFIDTYPLLAEVAASTFTFN